MNPKMAVAVTVGLVAVLLIVLALQGLVSGAWDDVAEIIAPVIVMIGLLGFAVVLIVRR